MLNKKNIILIIIFVLCCVLSIFSVHLNGYDKVLVSTAHGEIDIDDEECLKTLNDFFADRIYFQPLGYPACGFFENKSINFYRNNDKISFMIAPCDCGDAMVYENDKYRYVSIFGHEVEWLRDYISENITDGGLYGEDW